MEPLCSGPERGPKFFGSHRLDAVSDKVALALPGGQGALPPEEFFVAALRALRASHKEPVMIFTPTGRPSASPAAILALAELQHTVVSHVEMDRLNSAVYVAWGGRWDRGLIPRSMKVGASRPFEALWSWCDSEVDCPPLPPASVATVAVQVRIDRATVGKAARLLVRSTPTGSHEWVALPSSADDGSSMFGEWSRRSACVAHGADDQAGQVLLAQADPSTGRLLWPLRWPPHYTQGSTSPLYGSMLEPSFASQAASLQSDRLHTNGTARRWRAAGFVGVMQQDNLWHALHHAIPIREYVERLRARGELPAKARVDLIPRYTKVWPSSEAVSEMAEAAVRLRVRPPVTSWVGWELTVRGLTGAIPGEWERSARATQVHPDHTTPCVSELHSSTQPHTP